MKYIKEVILDMIDKRLKYIDLKNSNNHIAIILDKSNLDIQIFGINHIKPNMFDKEASIHAESDLLRKIIFYNYKKKNINIFVININRNKEIKNSKPCSHCIYKMKKFMDKNGYNIKNIYYSKNDKCIIKTSFNELYNDNNKHISWYFKYKNKF